MVRYSSDMKNATKKPAPSRDPKNTRLNIPVPASLNKAIEIGAASAGISKMAYVAKILAEAHKAA